MLIWVLIIAGVIWLDQLSKWLIITYLPDGGSDIIRGVLRFTYVENDGAAFGILSDSRWVFIVISTVSIIGIAVYLFWKRPKNKLLSTSLAFLVGGGVGNMIDRIFLGYVIDFIDFCAFPKIWKWVFNIADSFVCIGAGMLMLYLVLSIIEEEKAARAQKTDEAVEKGTDDNSEDNG